MSGKVCTLDRATHVFFQWAAVLFVALTARASNERWTPQPFEHYQPIIDRMPFGALPANFNPSADAAAAKNDEQVKADQQKLAKQVNMSAVNITPEGGTAIGFTDLSEKPPVNYYLLVGGEANGWKVVAADYDDETAVIEKDGVSITLKLGKGLVDSAAGPAAKPPAMMPSAPPALPAPLAHATVAAPTGGMARPPRSSFGARGSDFVPRPPPTSGSQPPATTADASKAVGSYKERLLERKQQEAVEQEAAAKKQQEQLETLAREAAQKEIKKREEEAAQAADGDGSVQNNAAPAPDETPQQAQ